MKKYHSYPYLLIKYHSCPYGQQGTKQLEDAKIGLVIILNNQEVLDNVTGDANWSKKIIIQQGGRGIWKQWLMTSNWQYISCDL